MAYPVTFAADFAEERSRLTTFFRYILAIPHFFFAAIVGIAAAFSLIISWFAIVFTGHYPPGLYSFNARFLEYVARLNGYMSLMTDRYPPFALGEDADYPVRVTVGPVLPEYDRLKTGLRLILMIPVYLIAYVLQLVVTAAAVISWFWIVITGRQNPALHSAMVFGLSYNMKAYGYYFLLTETWPPFSDEGEQLTGGAMPAATLSPTAAMPPPPPPPAAPEAPIKGSDIGLPDLPPPPPPSSPPPGGDGFTSGDPLG